MRWATCLYYPILTNEICVMGTSLAYTLCGFCEMFSSVKMTNAHLWNVWAFPVLWLRIVLSDRVLQLLCLMQLCPCDAFNFGEMMSLRLLDRHRGDVTPWASQTPPPQHPRSLLCN